MLKEKLNNILSERRYNNIMFDIHGVIDRYPKIIRSFITDFFNIIPNGKIYICSGSHSEKMLEELKKLNIIEYTKLISIPEYLECKHNVEFHYDEHGNPWCDDTIWWNSKGWIAHDYNIDIMFDDKIKYKDNVSHKTKFELIEPETFGVFVGRMCPLHIGHCFVIDKMITDYGYDNSLIVIGSANSPISFRVMFNYIERRRWINKIYKNNIKVVGAPDVPHSDEIWYTMLKDMFECIFPEKDPVFYVGSLNDIYNFPEHVNTDIVNRDLINVSGTIVRDLLLKEQPIDKWIHPVIKGEIISIFKKRIKQLDSINIAK